MKKISNIIKTLIFISKLALIGMFGAQLVLAQPSINKLKTIPHQTYNNTNVFDKGVLGIINGSHRIHIIMTDFSELIGSINNMLDELDQMTIKIRKARLQRIKSRRVYARHASYKTGPLNEKSKSIDDILESLESDNYVSMIEYMDINAELIKKQSRSMSEIKAMVLKHIGAISYEYSKLLKERPWVEGKIDVEFTIQTDGTVISAKIISSTMYNSTLENKLLNTTKTLVFSEIASEKGQMKVTFPFNFSSGLLQAAIN